MPQIDTLTCTCCHLRRQVRAGASDPFTCGVCRGHVGASDESQARRAKAHAGWYWEMWQGAEMRAERHRASLDSAGYKIERLQQELHLVRGDPADEDRMLTLSDRLRALHHVVLRTGKCSCGKDARCPTLRVVETT